MATTETEKERATRLLGLVDDAIEALLTGKQEIRRGARAFQGMTLPELRRLQQEYQITLARIDGTTVQQVVMRRRVYTPRVGDHNW